MSWMKRCNSFILSHLYFRSDSICMRLPRGRQMFHTGLIHISTRWKPLIASSPRLLWITSRVEHTLPATRGKASPFLGTIQGIRSQGSTDSRRAAPTNGRHCGHCGKAPGVIHGFMHSVKHGITSAYCLIPIVQPPTETTTLLHQKPTTVLSTHGLWKRSQPS